MPLRRQSPSVARKAHLDFETGSDIDLRDVGVHRYAEHPTTRIWMFCYALDHSPVRTWRPGYPFPLDLFEHVQGGGIVGAHNAGFERAIWNTILHPGYGAPALTIEQMDCTMARCSALAIPPGLDDAAHILNLTQRKDKAGHALMRKMAKPRHNLCIACEGDGCSICEYRGYTLRWFDEPENIERLAAYCAQDVETERELDAVAPALSPRERKVWELDQRINERGFMIDRYTAVKAKMIVDHAVDLLDKRLAEITGGRLTHCSEVKKIVAYLNAEGLECDSIAKEWHDVLLSKADALLRPDLREIVLLRKSAAKASTAKLETAVGCLGTDDRARDQFFYHGAAPGRWAGRLIQPQNLYRVDNERDGDSITDAIRAMSKWPTVTEAHDMLSMTVDAPMVIIPKCLRQMIVAPPGKHFIGGDQSNIEGRLAAWFGDEQWKIDAFKAFDAGLGPDLYKVSYSQSFGTPISEIDQPKRQIGKVQELALGYQGGAGAYVDMGKNYGLKIETLVPIVYAATDAATWETWRQRYDQAITDLPVDHWIACKIIVKAWRTANSRIVQCWWDLQDAAVQAMAEPGNIISVLNGRVHYLFNRGFLWLSLPVGRTIAYAHPELRSVKQDIYEDENGNKIDASNYSAREVEARVRSGEWRFAYQRTKRTVLYEGFESERRVWARQALYGGMQFNHVVQGTARDVIVENMLDAEDAGYPCVLTVHDELVAETPEWFGNAEEMKKIMTRPLPWLPGAPLAAKTWEGLRYEK